MKRLYFGTDGIRGVAGQAPLTAEFAFRMGVAAAETLKNGDRPSFIIGMDTRRSGPMLAHAVAAGLNSRGADTVFLGVMPTPAVSYLCKARGGDAGIMVSASHNPYYDNGIKLFGADGEKLPDALEAEIESRLENPELPLVTGAAIGGSSRYRHQDDDYYSFLLEQAPSLDGMRVALDCAHGASYQLAPRLFGDIGARLTVINAEPDGVNINVDCGSTHIAGLQERVRAQGLDAGVAFDGDADRALLVDRRGRLVSGDHILAMCALSRHETAVVATLMSNLGVEHYLRERGVRMLRTQVGDRYVLEALKAEGLTLGGEQSGHLLFLDKAPTGDGLLTALQTLRVVRESGKPLDAWVDDIPLYPQTLVNVRVADKAGVAERPQVKRALESAQRRLNGQGRINLRPSGTEPLIRVMVEGPSQEAIEMIANDIAAVVASG
jgi:phosphoglucosamine mutase